MSNSGMADYHKPSRRWNDSGELDVFEAARYFSGYNDNYALGGSASYMMAREERQGNLRAGRASLDLPSLKYHRYDHHHQRNHPNEEPHQHQQNHHHHQQQQQQQKIKDKKYKQPSSPGGKLAHFLNSLFNQAITSKKKKSTKASSQSMKDEDDSPSGRRRRRSSISHFRSTSSAIDAKSLYSCSSFGFRSPPPNYNNLDTPTKSFRSFSDHKEVFPTNLSKYNANGKNGNTKKDEQIKGSKLEWVDEKFKYKNGLIEKTKNFNHGCQDQNKKETHKFKEEIDDGAESDSSSDLFELQIDYGFGFCSSGLPVYETTHMDSINIKRPSATTVTNGAIQN